MKKSNAVCLVALSAVSCAALVGVQFVPGGALNNDFRPLSAGDSSYSLLYDNSIVVTDGVATAKTALNNDFSLTLTDSEASAGAFCKLNQGGTIVGSAPIKGLAAITIDYESGGELVAGFGGSNPHPLPDRAVEDEVKLETGYAKGASYFSIHAIGTTIINSIRLDYECVEPDVAISSLRVDTSLSKSAYMVGDTAVSSDFAVYAVFGTNGDQRLYPNQYTVVLDTSSEGNATATITYLDDNSKTAEVSVKVGSYAATASDIALENNNVYVTISGVFSGLTQEEFESMNWEADFQRHATLNGDGNWNREVIMPVFTIGEGTWSYKVDVTSYEGYYVGHLKDSPHVVDGDNELKISAAEDYSKRVTLDAKDYLLNYNLGKSAEADCWGNIGLKVFGHMEYQIIGTFDGWTGTGTTVNGRYNEAICQWNEGVDFKFRQSGVWNENAWGYDQIDWDSCPIGVVRRGQPNDNRDNNVIIVKGDYVMKLDLWTTTRKIVIGGDPFYGLVGNVEGLNWETGWGTDQQLTRASSETFAVRDIAMAANSEFKIRIGSDWGYMTFGADELAGKYSAIVKKGEESGHENNICILDENHAGSYDVLLNTKTGKVTLFRNASTYSFIGGFNLWNDVDLVWDSNKNVYSATVDLTTDGENWFKIRADHKWGYEFDWNNIGSYPEDAFEQKAGGTDFLVKKAGRYTVSLSKLTGKIDIERA